jgi:3-deoxy-D-arabino-heptulosonate 7-phosphate (DAHP) synthase class II
MPMMKNSTLFIVKKFNCTSTNNPLMFLSFRKIKLSKIKSSEEMKSAVYNPSAQTIRKIMDFARACNVMETETAGHIFYSHEMILN